MKKQTKCFQVIVLIVLSVLLFSSCEQNETPIEVMEETPVERDIVWNTLTDTAYLGGISSVTIKLVTKVAGYPQFNHLMKNHISVYKLVHKTVYRGDTILASGIISFPTDTSETRPVMLVGNGLIFTNNEAPSSFRLPDRFTGFEFIAATGYVTVISDMIGFGESQQILFPIHNDQYSASVTTDFYKAALEFIETKGIPITDQLFLAGYSQGAYTALSTLKQLEKDTSLSTSVTAASIGAGGFNLEYLFNYALEHNTYSAPSHLALLIDTYNSVYNWNRPLSDYFQAPYSSEIPELINGNYTRAEIDKHLPAAFDSILNPLFVQNLKEHREPEFTQAIRLNSIHNWAPSTPLKIFHSKYDERIPYTESEETVTTMQHNGASDVEFVLVNSGTHLEAAFSYIEQTFEWFGDLQTP